LVFNSRRILRISSELETFRRDRAGRESVREMRKTQRERERERRDFPQENPTNDIARG
jgi:hypothetical protein